MITEEISSEVTVEDDNGTKWSCLGEIERGDTFTAYDQLEGSIGEFLAISNPVKCHKGNYYIDAVIRLRTR